MDPEEQRTGRLAPDRPQEAADAGPDQYASDFDEALADVPILGDLFGSRARRDSARNERTRWEQDQYYERLMGGAPTVEQLTPDVSYESAADEYGSLLGGASEMAGAGQDLAGQQRSVLGALQRLYEQGGYTDADRSFAAAQRAQNAARLRGQNEAALAQAQARGMGGSGAELAMRLAAGEAMYGANAMQDAQLQQAAMQRALQALQGQGALASQARSQDMQRADALDAFNQRQLDYRRQRQQRNTVWGNQANQNRSNAYQQRYSNELNALGARQGAWNQQNSERRQDQENAGAFSRALMGGLGQVASGLLGGAFGNDD